MIGIVWIILGGFVALIASIPLRLSLHHFRNRQWEPALGNFAVGVILAGIAAAQFAYALGCLHGI